MSPRSEEFMAMARERLEIARVTLAAGFPSGAVSAAYYGTLYAARAALSEADTYARTHKGTWSLFGERFVATGRFDRALYRAAQEARETREDADYEAVEVAVDQARDLLVRAEAFVSAVEVMLGA